MDAELEAEVEIMIEDALKRERQRIADCISSVSNQGGPQWQHVANALSQALRSLT